MSDATFQELTESFDEAIAHARGQKTGVRITYVKVPPPPKARSGKAIMKLRKDLNCSQSVFARVLNISPKTIQAWEQGIRRPSDAALRLLEVVEKYPSVLFRL
jgi:putative transcriptional regulator